MRVTQKALQYIANVFSCMFLSCDVRVLESIYTLELSERQGTFC